MIRRRQATALVAVGLALGLTTSAIACDNGGGEDDLPSIEAVDFEFRPDRLDAVAGQQVTVSIRNRGEVVHNLSIPAINADVDFRPGERQNVIFVPPEAGEVPFFCKYHQDRGMRGVVLVRG